MSVTNVIRILSSSAVRLPSFRYSSSSTSEQTNTWDILSAVCLERRPIITSPTNELEKRFSTYLQKVEFEKSYKSDYELRKEKERRQLHLLKKGELSEAEIDTLPKLTAQDLEDAYQEEIKQFVFAPRITEADKNNDIKSLERLLDKYLILVVKQKLGNDYVWSLPQGFRENGETMRQAAERVLVEKCGENLQALFLGNAPCGFYKYKYPKDLQRDSKRVGAKVFFFKAWHLSGQVESNKACVKDYKWSCSEELDKDLTREYFKSVSQFIIDQ